MECVCVSVKLNICCLCLFHALFHVVGEVRLIEALISVVVTSKSWISCSIICSCLQLYSRKLIYNVDMDSFLWFYLLDMSNVVNQALVSLMSF